MIEKFERLIAIFVGQNHIEKNVGGGAIVDREVCGQRRAIGRYHDDRVEV